MSIWNKVLVGLILVASLGFFYMALRTLKTHQHWREKAQRHEEKIQDLQRENRGLVKGKGEGESHVPGIEELTLDLGKMMTGRGRVWKDCQPKTGPQTQQTGQVAVTTDVNGIGKKTLLHVFDDTDAQKGGSYLGTFKVLGVDRAKDLVTLEPSLKMTAQELQRLGQRVANTTWTMYEVMPADNHGIFAQLDEARLKELWPPGSPHQQQYANDGKTATWEQVRQWDEKGILVDDQGKLLVDAQGEPIEGVQGTYKRWLRDYDVLLKNYRLQRSELLDLKDAAAQDLAYVQDALAKADDQRKFREREKALLITQKQEADYARAAVEQLCQKLRHDVQTYRDAVDQLIIQNRTVAAEIEKHQFDAKRQIDARTARMAQSGAGDGR